jgi:hypothetical protein
LADAEAANADINAFAAMQEELEGILASGKLNQLTPAQFRQLQEAGIFKNNPATPGRTEPDEPAEITDSKPWWPGGSHYIIVEYLGRKMVYEFTSEGRTVRVSSPSYPMMNSYTEYSSVVNLVGDFPMWQSNESIWESLIEIPTSQFRWGFAEILYGIVPGGASATDIADGRYGMAGLHFAQDVAETVLIFGKLAKLSKFSKLSRLATLGERFGKNSKAAYAAIAVTELIGAGVSGVQAGQDAVNGNHKQAAINALQALFGVIGFSVSAKDYVAAAEKAAAASQKLAKAMTRIEVAAGQAELNKATIIASLKGYTRHGDRIASLIERGRLKVNLVGDELFEKMWIKYSLKAGTAIDEIEPFPQAFAIGEQLFVRRSSSNLLSDIVHEGTHGLDSLLKRPFRLLEWEMRAYRLEREFQLAGGGHLEFSSILEMLRHIMLYVK